MKWPDEALSEIRSREDLARFLIELSGQVRGNKTPVENSTAEGFIDAAGRWVGSMEGFFSNIIQEPVPENPDWAMVAAIFRAALVYE
ncbi:hypothetical protein CQJ94_09940 [Glycomyces fuscus]|uniref:DUF7660 family protein n=1 Tax=Nocardiopsis dassonvillei TaxID=2014 RepID=UPI000BE73FB0|nr:hypothetical protein CQJ94_09940 [Glycomyces fuscus]